jgi:hypothetical protein
MRRRGEMASGDFGRWGRGVAAPSKGYLQDRRSVPQGITRLVNPIWMKELVNDVAALVRRGEEGERERERGGRPDLWRDEWIEERSRYRRRWVSWEKQGEEGARSLSSPLGGEKREERERRRGLGLRRGGGCLRREGIRVSYYWLGRKWVFLIFGDLLKAVENKLIFGNLPREIR